MEHLKAETLARLVEELPTFAEREHLEACNTCATELEALRRQTDLLGRLPDLRPFPADFEALEARLQAEGLIHSGSRAGGRAGRSELAFTPRWTRRVAGVALFAVGAFTGALAVERLRPAGGVELAAASDPVDAAAALATVEEAERDYVAALVRYRQLTNGSSDDDGAGDPTTRYAALEDLVRAGQAAVRQAPADPFLNGLLASALAEQQAVSRRISSGRGQRDGWF
jgi:hypothetical protein